MLQPSTPHRAWSAVRTGSILLATLLLMLPTCLTAQEKKSFTLDDLMWGGSNYWNLQPPHIYTAWWGEQLVRLDVEQAYRLDPRAADPTHGSTLLTLASLEAALDTARLGHVLSLQNISFPQAGATLADVRTTKGYARLDWKRGRQLRGTVVPAGSECRDLCAETGAVAYVKGWDLYVSTPQGQELRLSTDGTRQLQYGRSVHRDEWGISKGTFWSPRGGSLAFYRMDQSMVSDFPLIDNAQRVATLAPEAYPMAGMTSHKVSVGVWNAQTGQTVYLQTADPTDRYFTNLAWSPDERTIYLFELPRTQDRAELVRYDAQTGKCLGTVYTEQNARYVEPLTPVRFLPWDERHMLMQSRRDGWNHLYLMRPDGTELRQLTQGPWEVCDVVGFCPADRSIVVRTAGTVEQGGMLAFGLQRLDMSTGRLLPLGHQGGTHRADERSLSASGRKLIDLWSSPEQFRQYDLVQTATGSARKLHQDASPWQDYRVPQIEGGTIKAADGKTDLCYRLVKPVDFDSTKRYPTVVYVYGGPHAHNVDASWNYLARPWEIYMAQRGYAVFVVDNRGSELRGFDFESCTHRHLGQVEMQDQMEGVKFLRSLPWVDTGRLGVHGWSFGGFMTCNLMCTYPDVFKVGVAGGPVIDWKWYEVMYGERYMDTPQENPEGYESSSLLPKAKNLRGRLQIIVGYNDPTCVMQHSLSFLRACQDAGTQPDYFVYPGQGHNMMGTDMVHLHQRITRYFDDYLK